MNHLTHFLGATEQFLAAWTRPMLIQSALVFVILLALDFPLRSRISSSARYALWLLFLVKLVLPPSFALPTSPVAWFPARPAPIPALEPAAIIRTARASQPARGVETPALEPAPRAAQPFGVALIWMTGMLVLSGYVARGAMQVRRRLQAAKLAPAEFEALAASCARELGLRRSVRLRLTTDGAVPMVCGLFRPTLLLPTRALDGLSTGQWRRVLLHELAHVRRGDAWLHWAQTALQIAYWWHPLVWAANRRIARLREEAVDDRIVAVLRGDSLSYCESLLATARFCHGPGPSGVLPASMAVFASKTSLAVRVERLMSATPALRGPAWQSWLLALSLGLLVLPMARGIQETPDGAAGPGTKGVSLVSKTYFMRDPVIFRLFDRASRSNGPDAGTNAAADDFWKQFGFATRPGITALDEKRRAFTLLAAPLEHERFHEAMARYLLPPQQIVFETTFIEGLATDINRLQLGRLFDQIGPAGSSAALGDGQARQIVVSAKQVKGLSLWTGPSLTTEEGRQAHVGSDRGDTAASVDMLGSLGDDQRKLSVTILPQLRIPAGPTEATGPKARVNLQAVAVRVIEDGQTVLVETQPKSLTNSSGGGRQLVALVTLTLVDRVGNRVNPPNPADSPGIVAGGTVVFYGEVKGIMRLAAVQPKYLSEAVLEMKPNQFANLKNVQLIRWAGATNRPKPIVVNVEEILSKGLKDKDYLLQDGDHVIIKAKMLNFH